VLQAAGFSDISIIQQPATLALPGWGALARKPTA